MTGSAVADVAIAVALALLLTWLVLVAVLILARPKGSLLREALRVLPDVLRLVRRLASDKALPPWRPHPALAAAGLVRAENYVRAD